MDLGCCYSAIDLFIGQSRLPIFRRWKHINPKEVLLGAYNFNRDHFDLQVKASRDSIHRENPWNPIGPSRSLLRAGKAWLSALMAGYQGGCVEATSGLHSLVYFAWHARVNFCCGCWVLQVWQLGTWSCIIMSSWDVCIVTWHWYLRACCVLCVVVALRRLVVLGGPCDTLESRVWMHVNTLEVWDFNCQTQI